MTAGRSRYGIIPADPPAGVSFPVWVVRDHSGALRALKIVDLARLTNTAASP